MHSVEMTIQVRAFWDEEAKVWVAESDDVPGLVTEAPSVDQLIEKLKGLIPELLAENGLPATGDIPVDSHIVSRHTANGVLKQAGLPKAF